MYRANQRYHKHRAFFRFVLIVLPIIIIIALIVWWFFMRGGQSSASFEKVGTIKIETEPTKEFTTPFYKVTLPASWKDNGRKNPFNDQVFYEYQNTKKNFENQVLKIYVDVYPKDLPITRLLPIKVVNGEILPGELSEECKTFSAKPEAKWQQVSFICDLNSVQNLTGTASAEEGYGTTISGSKASHKYFFTYYDFNVRPNYQLLNDTLRSFRAL